VIGWLAETLFATSVLMIVVLGIRRPVAKLFGARMAYALWLLPALRMILPPLPEFAERVAPVVRPMRHVFMPAYALPLPPVAASAPVDWMGPLATIWLAGAVLAFGAAMLAYFRFLKTLRTDSAPIGDLDGVPVWTTASVEGPLAFGIVRRVIALPVDYATQYAPDELDFALRHERMHHYRRDLVANMLALVARSIHWFNPVAYVAWNAFRADQEMACDAAVIAASGDRHTYAITLWKSAWGRLPPAACAMNGKGQLKRRLGMMNRKGNSPGRTLAGGVAIVTLLGVGLGLSASGGVAAEQVQHKRQQIVRSLVPPTPVKPVTPTTPDMQMAPKVPEVPDVQSVGGMEMPEPPAAPEAPEPPKSPDMNAVHAEVDQAMAEADRAMAEADLAMGEADKAIGECDARSRSDPCSKVDVAEIRRDVIDSLREAQRDMRNDDMPKKMGAEVIASLDRAIARMESDPRWR
jgi:bla regulator protein blaR1